MRTVDIILLSCLEQFKDNLMVDLESFALFHPLAQKLFF